MYDAEWSRGDSRAVNHKTWLWSAWLLVHVSTSFGCASSLADIKQRYENAYTYTLADRSVGSSTSQFSYEASITASPEQVYTAVTNPFLASLIDNPYVPEIIDAVGASLRRREGNLSAIGDWRQYKDFIESQHEHYTIPQTIRNCGSAAELKYRATRWEAHSWGLFLMIPQIRRLEEIGDGRVPVEILVDPDRVVVTWDFEKSTAFISDSVLRGIYINIHPDPTRGQTKLRLTVVLDSPREGKDLSEELQRQWQEQVTNVMKDLTGWITRDILRAIAFASSGADLKQINADQYAKQCVTKFSSWPITAAQRSVEWRELEVVFATYRNVKEEQNKIAALLVDTKAVDLLRRAETVLQAAEEEKKAIPDAIAKVAVSRQFSQFITVTERIKAHCSSITTELLTLRKDAESHRSREAPLVKKLWASFDAELARTNESVRQKCDKIWPNDIYNIAKMPDLERGEGCRTRFLDLTRDQILSRGDLSSVQEICEASWLRVLTENWLSASVSRNQQVDIRETATQVKQLGISEDLIKKVLLIPLR